MEGSIQCLQSQSRALLCGHPEGSGTGWAGLMDRGQAYVLHHPASFSASFSHLKGCFINLATLCDICCKEQSFINMKHTHCCSKSWFPCHFLVCLTNALKVFIQSLCGPWECRFGRSCSAVIRSLGLALFVLTAPPVVGWGQAGPVPNTTSGPALSANLRKVLWLLGALGYDAHDDLPYRRSFQCLLSWGIQPQAIVPDTLISGSGMWVFSLSSTSIVKSAGKSRVALPILSKASLFQL